MQQPSTKTILIVEDQFELRAINAIFLERHGYRVLAVENGAEGVRSAREQRPDLIIMDLSVPVMDGFSATRQLKQDPATRDIPVLVLTAHSYGSAGRRAREAGCDAFLVKPCAPQRLLREVQQRIGPADTRVH
jgi:two-component system, cell cycle response regulator DivK